MASVRKKVLDHFDSDSGDEDGFNTNNKFASHYEGWRRKEHQQKLKDRYGEVADDTESSSEDEVVAPKLDKDFFKALSSLKKKDSKIYDANVAFFKEIGIKNELSVKTACFKNMPIENEDDNEDFFTLRNKTQKEKEKEDADFIEWLKGNQDDVEDIDAKTEMKDLHDYWNNPQLDNDEKFLKDYILNERYMDEDDDERFPSYDEIVHDSEGLSEDEKTLETQDYFEHKYNFRYEEPDQDFIKHYPRTLTDVFRRQDEKRKKKRAEFKEKKLQEKERKNEELKQLKALKRMEIMEKLEKLQKITGNTTAEFDKDFLKGDFDPEVHEKKMKEIFDNEYYDEADESKPEFEVDEEIDGDYENWDEYENYDETYDNGLHCEDPDFNMDADYQPSVSHQKEVIDKSPQGKRKKKSKLAELVQKKKPVFNENERTFDDYIEEYYKLDYEDIIGGDLPCRFKYRETVPNNFGLSYEEILKADDKELNKWSSLKKTFKYRNEDQEKYDVQAYNKKSKDLQKKMQILTSVYTPSENEDGAEEEEVAAAKMHKKKRAKVEEVDIEKASTSNHSIKKKNETNNNKKKLKRKEKFSKKEKAEDKISDNRLRAYGINPKKFNNKLKIS
uniref:Protein KRI1 homolog n=1 Tax=Strigamia maritima TaxID=126957 RepID=T1J5R0_STRMM